MKLLLIKRTNYKNYYLIIETIKLCYLLTDKNDLQVDFVDNFVLFL